MFSEGRQPSAGSFEHLLSRRTVLKVAGGVGITLGVCVGGRLAYLLAQNHTLVTYRGHDTQIQALAWSPDSQWIASTSGAEVQVCAALNGRLMHRFSGQYGFERVAWSPDGKYLAIGSRDLTVSVWQIATSQRVLTYRGHAQGLAGSSPHAALVEQTNRIGLHPMEIIAPGIESLAWSPDGTRLISSGSDRTTQAWEALTGKPLLSFGSLQDYYRAGSWSPDGQHLLMHTERGIQRHVAATGALEFTFSIGSDWVSGPSAWSPNGRWLATVTNASPVHLWDVATGRQILTYGGHSDPVIIVAWSHDSLHVASAGYDLSVRVWNAASGQTDYIYRGHMNPFQLFFQGGILPGTTDASQLRFSPSTASAESEFKSAGALLPQDTGTSAALVGALAWAPNGQYLASGGSDNTVQVWQPG